MVHYPVCAWTSLLHIEANNLYTDNVFCHNNNFVFTDYEEMVHQEKTLCHGGNTKRGS